MPFAAPSVALPGDVRVTGGDGALTVHTTLRVDADEPYQSAHFPELTILPGVFVIEAVRQAVALALGGRADAPPDITEVRSARFLAPVLAGDEVSLDATVVRDERGVLDVDAHCRRRDGLTAARVRVQMAAPSQETDRP